MTTWNDLINTSYRNNLQIEYISYAMNTINPMDYTNWLENKLIDATYSKNSDKPIEKHQRRIGKRYKKLKKAHRPLFPLGTWFTRTMLGICISAVNCDEVYNYPLYRCLLLNGRARLWSKPFFLDDYNKGIR